ncbi:hypothetical protein GLOTRDRAFT_127318 [Gloeophyllum trabeum ATCC 11539]|uniref:Uncharacterized protein n=1 Tax=Gloeophyllum trabeum (strain ATCC 11539 / FP-39264 / Madison 617) TaxID=670483 RepID=S7QC55_GLOTA|nr:uncharacterized protein GLOTRDRAFT_127318 [Gloeophyllum trabeum ATCC 11539]EPQ56932.1 hypothetical protein GLOTRDRAFT_127318 [Gloeophyllum trabeum ATCC 11539]
MSGATNEKSGPASNLTARTPGNRVGLRSASELWAGFLTGAVRDTASAKTYLIKKNYILETERITLGKLADALMATTKETAGKTWKESVQAVAFLLRDEEVSGVTDYLCTAVEQRIESLEQATLTKIDALVTKVTSQTVASTDSAGTATYRNALLRPGTNYVTPTVTPVIARATAQAKIRARQILIDIADPVARTDILKLADKVLFDKANNIIREFWPDKQGLCDITAASKLSTGGILYENSDTFEEQYHPTAVVKDRQPCAVLTEFVPIQFDPDRSEDLREIEEVNEY